MVQAYSADLRIRVIEAAADGLSARQAAERFEVGISTAIVWIRRFRATGEIEGRRQGKRPGSRLDAHEAFILALVEDGTKDITLAEIADQVAEDCDLRVGTTAIWTFLDRRGLTFKKRPRTRPSRTALT
jgi:transposase